MLTLPNLLTLSRILAVPLLGFLLWWPEWQLWLARHSSAPLAPPAMGTSLGDAPGEYVLQR